MAKAHSQIDSPFRGSVLARLDGRGRVTLPTFIRATAERFGHRSVFLAEHESEPCIVGFGNPEIDQPYTAAEILSMKEGGGPSSRPRRFTSSETTPWDASGRIVLNAVFRESASIKDAILFLGVGDFFEMWSPTVAARSDEEDLRDLARRYLQDARPRRQQAIPSSGWTGRFSPAEHARFVRILVPEAQISLRQIIAAYEDKLDNAPPEPLDAKQLQALRRLHAELGALLEACDSGHPLAAALTRIRKLSTGMWGIGQRSQRLLLRSAPALATSVPASFALIKILELMLGGFEPLGRAGVAAAVTGGILKFGARESEKD